MRGSDSYTAVLEDAAVFCSDKNQYFYDNIIPWNTDSSSIPPYAADVLSSFAPAAFLMRCFMQIIEMQLDELIPYANNPRNNDGAVDKVAASIREFGFKVPIIVDKNNVIVAGHTRLKAAQKLGLEKVPVIRADDLTDEQVNAFRLADNKTAEFAAWDFSKLDEELANIDIDMSDFGFDFDFDETDDEPDGDVLDGGQITDKTDAKVAVKIIFQNTKTWKQHEDEVRNMIDGFENVSVSVGENNDNF